MTEPLLLSPGLVLIFGALLLPFLSGAARQAAVLALPLLTLLLIWTIPLGAQVPLHFMEYELMPLRASAEGRLFATVFALLVFVGGLYALRQARVVELSAAFAYAGSAIGVTFAGDLITLLVFWEMMSIGSALVLLSNCGVNPKAYKAALRYLLVHQVGGLMLMAGIILYYTDTGSVAFTAMQPESLATTLILLSFLINAGAPPLSALIADAYPEASPSGMVFLSAFTTKTAVFVLLVGFAGAQVLIYIGLYMVFYGIIYALLENDMRRILAYSIVNQVGFMVTAIGIGSELALNGAAAHAFTHIIYKALLLMSAGSVLLMTGKRRCTELGGLFQTMPVTAINGIIGALAISAFPFTSGFVTKSLETAAAAEQGMVVVWFLLLAASAGVFLHAGIKFPWFVFFQKDSGLRAPDPAPNMRVAMWIFSFLCIGIGVFPQPLYAILPYPVSYEPYTLEHLITQFQLLLFAGFAFFALLPLMRRTPTISLDFDWFYRSLGRRLAGSLVASVRSAHAGFVQALIGGVMDLIGALRRHFGQSGILSRTWPSADMVMWVVVLLAATLMTFYIQGWTGLAG